jgi:hypothetical protein
MRTIANHCGPDGPSKTALLRHRSHIAGTIVRRTQARETARTETLLGDVRIGIQRAEELYRRAEALLTAAIDDGDRGGAAQAIRSAVSVLSEARGYLHLRGELTNELGRDRTLSGLSIQIVCPSAPSAEMMPRISFTSDDAIDAGNSVQEIGILQFP